MLLVRIAGIDRDRRSIQPSAKSLEPGIPLLQITASLLPELCCQETADAGTNEHIRNEAMGEKGIETAHFKIRKGKLCHIFSLKPRNKSTRALLVPLVRLSSGAEGLLFSIGNASDA